MRATSAIQKMTNLRKLKGRVTESLATFYLLLAGYTPLKRNMRTPVGEVDILAKKGQVLCVVEVKYRKSKAAALYALKPDQVDRLHTQLEKMIGRYGCDEYRCDAALFYAHFPYFTYIKNAF